MTSPSQVHDTAAPALKPCPFCGGPADYRRYFNGDTSWIVIDCASDDCPSSPDTYGKDFEEAAQRWNTRDDPPQLPDGLMKDMAKALERARPFVESARITATLRSVEDLGERERPLTMLMSQIDAVLDRYHATKDLPDAR